MERIVARSRELLDRRGPSSIGFYTSGQLFAEEYYTQAAIAHGAIGTNHVDGNARLCTATAAEALKESFGCDGQPGSYTDVDHADVIALFGHNVAETQTVLWARMLDRLAGSDPPAIVCVDPRLTPVARHATVHLAPLPGTNVALMNGLLHEIIGNGWIDRDYIDAHTVGLYELQCRIGEFMPGRVAEICDVDAAYLRRAARLIGTARRQLSTMLQGFYQSHQATAAAVQVNNIHLVRGILWVTATNPAVSLPELPLIRDILSQQRLFLVVQDIFLTETAALADVVCRPRRGRRRRAPSPTPTARCTCPKRPWSHPVSRVQTWRYSWTTRAGWTSATRTAGRFRRGPIRSRRSRRERNAARAGRATTPA